MRYAHPTHGFSFEYPADWFINDPHLPDGIIADGVTIASFNVWQNPPPVERNLTDYLKIDFDVAANPMNLSLAEWLSLYSNPSRSEIISSRSVTVAGREAVREERFLDQFITLTTMVALEDSGSIYRLIAYYPSESGLVPDLDRIVESFRIER